MAKKQAQEVNLCNETDRVSWSTRVAEVQVRHQRHEYDSLKPLYWERKVEEFITADAEYRRLDALQHDLFLLLKTALPEEAQSVLFTLEETQSECQSLREQLLLKAGYQRGYLDAARGHCATVELD